MTADAGLIDERAHPDSLDSTIRAAQAGDAAAFEDLMVLTERRVAQIAWAILGDAEDVKDAVQETFLRLYRFLGRYDANRDFPAWLSRIAVNVCRDALRRRKRVFWKAQSLAPTRSSFIAASSRGCAARSIPCRPRSASR